MDKITKREFEKMAIRISELTFKINNLESIFQEVANTIKLEMQKGK